MVHVAQSLPKELGLHVAFPSMHFHQATGTHVKPLKFRAIEWPFSLQIKQIWLPKEALYIMDACMSVIMKYSGIIQD